VVAALHRPLAGAANRVNHVVDGARRRRGAGGNLELVLFDGDTVGVLALDDQQADRRGGHRHPKHHVHLCLQGLLDSLMPSKRA
jgi:hypothetical protein